MGKIAGKVPKLQEKLFDFPYFRQKFDRIFLSPYRLRKKTSKKKEQSATVPKDVYCYRYCFLETKECMHNEVGTCAEILPNNFPQLVSLCEPWKLHQTLFNLIEEIFLIQYCVIQSFPVLQCLIIIHTIGLNPIKLSKRCMQKR